MVTKIKNSCLKRLPVNLASNIAFGCSIFAHFWENSEGSPLQDLEIWGTKNPAKIHIPIVKNKKKLFQTRIFGFGNHEKVKVTHPTLRENPEKSSG